ncbi:MAG: ATP-binding protein [Muribaculaceae bacterium]|nr:ATP-binding protein [Muribaculaceae bacterium]
MEETVYYPIGEQDFKSLRETDCIYIDKTRYVAMLVAPGSKYYFLARPRRFGKSLFLSTLQQFFEGKRELFKGLYIDSVKWDWEAYPVLRLDLNMERYAEPGKLDDVLDKIFRGWEAKYGIDVKDRNHTQRFATIIEAAHKKTGRQVVILVDEYDKPLVGNLNEIENFEHYRSKLAAIYSNFKSCAEHIRFVFLTGVSRFSKLSVFSDLNNLNDITFSDEYADICGITHKELLGNFQIGVDKLARKMRTSYEDALKLLKSSYDGYRFSAEGSEIYNPWSLLNALNESRIGNYWNATGKPTLIVEALKRIDADLQSYFNSTCTDDELRGLDLLDPQPLALLYQTGYLTIKDYNFRRKKYRLGIPNHEVKKGLLNELLPYYVNCKGASSKSVVSRIEDYILDGEPERFMREIQIYFAGVSYKMKMDNENNFHNAFFILTDLIGLETHTEVSTSDGSIDILITTEDFIYIIELKYDRPAQEALRQIEKKRYDRPYLSDNRKIFRIGVSFSSKTRTIEDWVILQHNS